MKFIKNIISFGLVALIVQGSFHVNFHHSHQPDGYSICDVECKNEIHHYSIHICDQCLNRNSHIIYPAVRGVTHSKVFLTLNSINECFTESPIPFSLYSRPPPREYHT